MVTDIAKSWVTAFLCMIGMCLLIGCGAEEEVAVYDTTANPHGFPTPACDMLDAIEAGRLATYDVITEAFGRLYLENQELLENRHWQEVIKLLGRKFHHRADEMLQQGVTSYTRAAGFYILAAFANPNDAELSEKAQLFTAWKETVEKLDYNYVPLPTSYELTDRLDFLRCFVLGDSLQRRFAEQYLIHELLDSMVATEVATDLSSISPVDGMLLAYLRMVPIASAGPITTWKTPPVHLLARRLVAVGPQRVRAELYFTAVDAVSENFRVALAVDPVAEGDSVSPGGIPEYRYHIPQVPTSSWSPHRINITSMILAFSDSTAWVRANFSRAGPDESGASTDGLVRPPLTEKQQVRVERLSER